MKRIILILLALSTWCPAPVYDKFPGFESLFEQADFVGIVILGERVLRKEEKERGLLDWGPHRIFPIKSVVILKGEKIDGDLARLADRRLGSPHPGEILTPDKMFLVFLIGSSKHQAIPYRWGEIGAEGSVLPVSPKTNLYTLDPAKKFELFRQIVADYTTHCKELSEHAMEQQRLVDKFYQDGVGQTPPTPAPKSEEIQKPQTGPGQPK